MDDYGHLFYAYLSSMPQLTLSSSALQPAVVLCLLALSCPLPETQMLALDTLVALGEKVSHAQWGPVVGPIFAHCGETIFSLSIEGVVNSFPEDSWPRVSDILSATARVAQPMEVEGWATKAVTAIPAHLLPASVRQEFLGQVHEYDKICPSIQLQLISRHLLASDSDKLRNAVNMLVRSARMARERGRQTRKSLGA